MMRPSNSGTATWVATSSGDMPVVAACPLGPRAGQAQPLQDRHVQRGERADVPAVVVTAGADRRPVWRRRPPARSPPWRRRSRSNSISSARRGSQRCTVQRQRRGRRPASIAVGTARRRRRCSRPAAGRGSRAPRRSGPRSSAAVAGQQRPSSGIAAGGAKPCPVSSTVSDRKRVQLRQVVRAALGQVDVRLGAMPAGTVERSISSASGACSPLTTTTGTPPASTASRPSCPGPAPAEDAGPPPGRPRRAAPARSSISSRDGLAQR